MKSPLLFLPLAIFAAIAWAFAAGLGRDPAVLPSALIDKPVPTFSLVSVEDGASPLTSETLKGKVALLNVFASWCGPCRSEHPTLLDLARRNEIPIYGLNWKESPADCLKYLAEAGNPYAAIGSDEAGKTALDFGVTGAPETFILDRTGRIRYKQVGPITEDVWRDTIAPIVAQLEREP